jgi:glutamate 5-kinase
MGMWDELFSQHNQPIAQILLTRGDISERTCYLNITNTMDELLNLKVIPIINENDSVSSAEIRFGDNDTLAALVAGMVPLKVVYYQRLMQTGCFY